MSNYSKNETAFTEIFNELSVLKEIARSENEQQINLNSTVVSNILSKLLQKISDLEARVNYCEQQINGGDPQVLQEILKMLQN